MAPTASVRASESHRLVLLRLRREHLQRSRKKISSAIGTHRAYEGRWHGNTMGKLISGPFD